MGTWGAGSFESDDAQQFLSEVMEDGAVALHEAFEVALDPDLTELEAPEGVRVVAAAEVLAALLTRDYHALGDESEALAAWARAEEAVDADELEEWRALALAALGRVQAEDSELRQLWQESNDWADWQREVRRLIKLLSANEEE